MSNAEEDIFTLAKKNNNNKLFKLISKDKSNINKLNKEGYSLLHIAIMKGNINMLNKLLQLKANPNITTTNKKQTPLHFAYIYGNDKAKEIIKILKSFKVDENLLDIYNKKPIDYLNNQFFEKEKENLNKNSLLQNFNKINNKILGDIDICENNENEDYSSLEDSLERPIKKTDISDKNLKNSNNLNLKTESKTPNFKYPNLFKNIINNNLKNNSCNKINKTDTQIFKEILSKKRNSLNFRNSNLKINRNSSTGFISSDSTEERTKSKINKEKISIITNKDVIEFNYEDTNSYKENNALTHNINNINTINNSITNVYNNNTSFNVLNKETITENVLFTKKYTNKPTIDININLELKYWLDNFNLSQYLDNFIQNGIFDINTLINLMDNSEHKLNYDNIESLLKIHKPGHIYRIFTALEIFGGIISPKVSNFLIKKNSRNNVNKSKNNLKLSVSREINSCSNCFRINFLFSQKKNDLKSFLSRYNLNNFYQNFYHNGFDLMNYVMAQMFSSEPIDEFILENCFHIYEKQDREKVLKCLLKEKNKINYFLNSNEYLQFNSKHNIKYEDIIFEKKENSDDKNNDMDNSQNEKIVIANNSFCIDCIIF